jgi:hypothetical protein
MLTIEISVLFGLTFFQASAINTTKKITFIINRKHSRVGHFQNKNLIYSFHSLETDQLSR